MFSVTGTIIFATLKLSSSNTLCDSVGVDGLGSVCDQEGRKDSTVEGRVQKSMSGLSTINYTNDSLQVHI